MDRRKPLGWVLDYRKDWLARDVMAGLITAAVVIPKAMAYATVAGLPVQVGLYTALAPMLIYALFGTSRPLSVSTTTTIAIMVGTELGLVVPGGDPALILKATASLAVMVGAILVVASFLRLGFIANFISEPVLVGFKGGIALVIILDQIPKLLGVNIGRGGFIQNLASIVHAIPETSLATLAVGVVMIAILIGLEHFVPRAPAPLIAVAVGIVGMRVIGLGAYGVSALGEIPRGLPSWTMPDVSMFEMLWPGALGIALMSFTETIAAGRAFVSSDEPPLRTNQELFALGLANAGGAFLGGMPAGGGTTQTAVNRLAGARSQAAEMVTAGATLLTMLLLAPFISLMPQATLAAIVIVYSVGLFKPAEFRGILKVRRTEFVWALIALAGVVLLGTLKGILVAIVASLVAIAYQAAAPPIRVLGRKPGTNVFRPISKEHPEDETWPGLLLIEVEGRIFFVNAERVSEQVRQMIAEAGPKVIALYLRGVPDLEYTALKMLIEAERKLRERGVALWLVGLNPAVLAMIKRSPLGETLGRDGLLFNLETAVANYTSQSNQAAEPARKPNNP